MSVPTAPPLTPPASGLAGAVVIGRNEGARLLACLDALTGQVGRVVYVDSGSSDGSPEAARVLGAEVVSLDMTRPFTAARARNAGLARLAKAANPPDFVLFLDGDTQLRPGFLTEALKTFALHPAAVVVCGRRREIAPDASRYNRLIDREWDTPIGPARACGGDALMRLEAVQAVGGYAADLIAGEEPDLCLRMIAKGGEIWRIGAEMTLHDAAIKTFGQWWRRSVRAGHAFAEGWARHGFHHWGRETIRALVWGAALPLGALMALALFGPMGLLVLGAYPLQAFRLARRGGAEWAVFTLVAKFAEAWGAMGYAVMRIGGRQRRLIEYK